MNNLFNSLTDSFLFNHQAKFTEFKIQNMVGSCDVKFPIRLEGLVLAHGQFSRYISWLYLTANIKVGQL